ncbi:MAG TPA: hypothetical protein VKB02_14045 [Pyrinomonadaceae bacterium]|nr:hypothetical protein [Pyrinomonadaceae bacterium]
MKRELGTLGITFLAEMLGRVDISENDRVLDAITEKEAIKLAEELGMVTRTEAIRLRHCQELVSHFSQRDPVTDDDPMEVTEAVSVLLACVRSVLAKTSLQVAREFADFRRELEMETFAPDDSRCEWLVASPYFFRRLAVSVLLSGIRLHTGARLEHSLSNLNLLLPRLWSELRDPERWQVGATYAQVYADGLQTQTSGLKQALLKVRGVDYVPENIRSQTFIKAAEGIIRAHEGLNNFYNEYAPTVNLEKLGTVIPAPALGSCLTALLCVRLGNSYGISWSAHPIADRLLKKQSADRWSYYFDNVFSRETRIIEKLQDATSRAQWLSLVPTIYSDEVILQDKTVKELLTASLAKDDRKTALMAQRLIATYYVRGR